MREKFCSSCGSEFRPKDLSVRCRLCLHNYHAGCWKKTSGCTTWGCAGNLSTGQRDDGDYKRCPSCSEEIVAFAVKCRYCRSDLVEPDKMVLDPAGRKQRSHPEGFRKDPILAGLLNLIFPGAGYMYLGYFSKGLLWFLIAVLAWFFTRGLGLIAVYAWVIYDSAREAVKINRGIAPAPKNVQRR